MYYKYTSFDYGWGCGWRTIQNMVDKLFNIPTTIYEIMQTLTKKKFVFAEDHYGFLDVEMANSYFADFPVTVAQYNITNTCKLDHFINTMKNLDYTQTCIMMIHDGYIVMINNFKNNKIEVIDPHQHYKIDQFIDLKKVGFGGIGWIDFTQTIFENMSVLSITNHDDFLQLNPPCFLVVALNNTS